MIEHVNPRAGLMVARYLRSIQTAHKADAGRDAAAAFASSQGWANEHLIVNAITKAGVAGTSDADLAIAPLTADLAEVIRPLTILGRLQGVKRVPFYSRLIGMSAGTSARWIGHGIAAPVSRVAFSAPADLGRKKVGALLVTTDEFLRDGAPTAERALVADLAAAVAAAMDAAFIDVAGTADAQTPASITSGGASTASTGSSLAQVDADLSGLVDDLVTAGENLAFAHWVMSPRTATYIARLRGSGGALAYPNVGVKGGEIYGLPVIVSGGVPTTPDTAATTQISLVSGDGVLLADQDEAELSFSRHASIEMDSAPQGDTTAPAGATANMVSMFQSDSVGIQVIRSVNWLARRATVAATLTSVSY